MKTPIVKDLDALLVEARKEALTAVESSEIDSDESFAIEEEEEQVIVAEEARKEALAAVESSEIDSTESFAIEEEEKQEIVAQLQVADEGAATLADSNIFLDTTSGVVPGVVVPGAAGVVVPGGVVPGAAGGVVPGAAGGNTAFNQGTNNALNNIAAGAGIIPVGFFGGNRRRRR